ncbi:MAG TPA: enterochelin esterase domain-containing protein, partial [Ktedonobacteraceae bacterium]
MIQPSTVTSPRIVSLQRDLETGHTQALDDFWQDLLVQGTPLIEAIPEDETQVLVTFLWKDSGDTQQVMVFNGPDFWINPTDNQLLRLLHTNLWYKTYKARADMRNLYFFSHNGPLDFSTEDWSKRVLETFRPDQFNPYQFEQVYSGSILELPAALPQPWIIPRPEIPKGRVEERQFTSTLLGNERRVWVYTPPGY